MDESRKKHVRRLASLLLLAAVTAGLYFLVGRPLIGFVSEPARFREWVDEHGIWGRAAYIGMVIFQVIVAVIPGEPFEIAAGYAFGAVEGTVCCLIGAALGSMLTFLLVRKFGMRLVLLFFEEEQLEKLRFLKSGSRRDLLFLLIYMIPGTPKDLLSYFAGLTDMRFPVWMLICSLGRIPSVVTSTVSGDALGTRDYSLAAAVFAVTLAISLAGLLVYERICRKKATPAKRPEESSCPDRREESF